MFTVACERCGERFVPRKAPGGQRQRYCGKACKDRAFHERHKDSRRVADRERKAARSSSVVSAINRRYAKPRHDDPLRYAARLEVNKALKRGDLVRGACEVAVNCRGRIEAHHDDYQKPLDVRWLCAGHHGELRRKDSR